jgi:hypothetical protein
MTRLLFLLMLATLASSLRAETYAQREDVQAFVADMNTGTASTSTRSARCSTGPNRLPS